jgi:hypothetical protein
MKACRNAGLWISLTAGLIEDEFLRLAMGHVVSPYEHDPAKVVPGKAAHDHDHWLREVAMSREDAEAQLAR